MVSQISHHRYFQKVSYANSARTARTASSPPPPLLISAIA